ncbi:AlpA family transcriptional regulator [Pseudomonas sp. GD04087]|uniref:AlpA family transcriptional regulator n=1 Tax=Pseudomonas TaxID=286 RepID=UPI0014749FBB|nr:MULTISPECIES: AlpA family transcriptional regulator [Pseudomonas]MDH0293172.1 AlpA family transcriptional regulator [Pseudomonas sp. GD04087]MDH1052970.1 AlpA family transcriptional regulator [Pseudomonas sp. GD03903]MDH2003431.1 AlpA family transcriptional regulator [Pseudomonas sp. GD03691]NMZ77645.1 AlpA family transcriptional regulator [Pseudomonas nitroreducens]
MRIMRLQEVMATTGLARSTIYKFISEGTFPKTVPLGGRSVGWVEEEVQDWVLERIEERDATLNAA